MTNPETAAKLYDAWNRRDWQGVRNVLSPSGEWSSPALGARVRGRESVIALLRSSADAFPGARLEVLRLHEAGDTVVAECAYRLSGKGSPQSPSFCEILRFENGRCVAGTTYADSLRNALDLSVAA